MVGVVLYMVMGGQATFQIGDNIDFDVDANPKISISILAALPWRLGKYSHFRGEIVIHVVIFFFAGAPPPHPRPLAGAG